MDTAVILVLGLSSFFSGELELRFFANLCGIAVRKIKILKTETALLYRQM